LLNEGEKESKSPTKNYITILQYRYIPYSIYAVIYILLTLQEDIGAVVSSESTYWYFNVQNCGSAFTLRR